MIEEDPELVVMLTYNDVTVEDAREIFEECKNTKAVYWGMKEKGLPLSEMKSLFSYMKSMGKKTVLEVPSYTEKDALNGVEIAVDCGCDILMGTCFFDSVNQICIKNNIKYMPFVGVPQGRPSILTGEIEDMLSQASEYIEKNVYGFDLLAYRYVDDSSDLIKKFADFKNARVCIAGSVGSYAQLDEIKNSKVWAFTVGSAFFDNKFGVGFPEQINAVCEYISK